MSHSPHHLLPQPSAPAVTGFGSEHSPLLLHQGNMQQLKLFPAPHTDFYIPGTQPQPNPEDDEDNCFVASNYPKHPKDADFVSERLQLLPGSPLGVRQRPKRQAGLSVGSISPPYSSDLSPPVLGNPSEFTLNPADYKINPSYCTAAPSDYTEMSPQSLPGTALPMSVSARVTPPPHSLSSKQQSCSSQHIPLHQSSPLSEQLYPPFSPAPPVTPNTPVLQLTPDLPTPPAASLTTDNALLRDDLSSVLFRSSGMAGDASRCGGNTSESASGSHHTSSSEGGSKESTTSSGSDSRQFNGHGPFSHQQAALC